MVGSNTILGLLLPFLMVGVGGAIGADVPSFNRDIRPILSDRCFTCHGPDEKRRKADLRLDTREGATVQLDGHYAIVPGDPKKSELVARIQTDDADDMMPPSDSHLTLSPDEKNLLIRWIKGGAVWEEHWSFQPIVRSLPDSGRRKPKWGRNAVDSFVLADLRNRSIRPSPDADRVTWLRRVTQDITGLPPTLSDVDSFLEDHTKGAHEAVVNRLLDSDDYAERMTLIWLDNARYADSNGFQFDNQRTMWPWRDWVLGAFRKNMPYDQFVTEQLAGDLIETPSESQLIATGFNRNHGYSIEGGIIDEEYRMMYANDKTTTFGTLFLGLTMECTSCHDHKYDPLTMTDYYSLLAFFNTSAEVGAPGENGRKQKAAAPFIDVVAGADDAKSVRVMVMKEKPRPTYLLGQGQFDQPGEKVTPVTPATLPGFAGYRTDRLGLAQWLTSKENPLFARVVVNRLWQQFFGVGIVKTSDNFGLQGDLPSHPELLDWLAGEFRESGWDLHHMIRLITLSQTYGQSSVFRPKLADPENRLLARGSSFRLPGELIRDQALAVSSLLKKRVGGPSVKPYQPQGVWEDLNAPKSHAETYVQSVGDDRYRKSLYTYWRRAALHPALASFDAPSRDVCTVKREITNTPLQAFVTLHGTVFIESSVKTAESAGDRADAIDFVFRTILSRTPTRKESKLLGAYYKKRLNRYEGSPDAVESLLMIGDGIRGGSESARAKLAALADVCHVILNSSESLTRK